MIMKLRIRQQFNNKVPFASHILHYCRRPTDLYILHYCRQFYWLVHPPLLSAVLLTCTSCITVGSPNDLYILHCCRQSHWLVHPTLLSAVLLTCTSCITVGSRTDLYKFLITVRISRIIMSIHSQLHTRAKKC